MLFDIHGQRLDASRSIVHVEGVRGAVAVRSLWHWEHWRRGELLREWTDENITVNEGLNEILDKFWKGSTYTAAHYVGLTDGTPTVAAGDTMASHAGWAFVTAYSEANRPTLTLGTVASQSVDNSASKASFSINGTTTAGGAFCTTNNTKGGSTGTLINVVAFTGGDASLSNGDTLNVTVTLTAASA